MSTLHTELSRHREQAGRQAAHREDEEGDVLELKSTNTECNDPKTTRPKTHACIPWSPISVARS